MTRSLDLPAVEDRETLRGRIGTDPHRPAFHFVAPAGWLNDPNGLTHRDGWYHLFYQYNPAAALHEQITWGHARSRDLVHWEHLPVALAPGGVADADGCWSGVLVDDAGVPTILYSGHRDGARPGPLDGIDRLCVATGSPDLLSWTKDTTSVVGAEPPAGLDLVGFRDHCVWREDGRWRQLIGAGIRGVGGTALLYESDDLRTWRYVGPLLVGDLRAQPRSAADWSGTMWECVDLFRIGDGDVLMFSAWDEGVTHHPLYWSGRYTGDRFEPLGLHRVDLGGRYFYAPQSMVDAARRRIMFGWMQEGRPDAVAAAAGWAGVMSVPRVVTAGQDGSIAQTPAPELEGLRTDLLHDGDGDLWGGVRGDQLDLDLQVHLPAGAVVTVTVRASEDGRERTVYRLARLDDTSAELVVDRTASSLDPDVDTSRLGGSIPLRGDRVRLRLLIDHSALEAFANGVPLAARVYPTLPDALGVAVASENGAKVSMRAWRMAAARPTVG